MTIEKGDATKYVHTGNGELCYELNKGADCAGDLPHLPVLCLHLRLH